MQTLNREGANLAYQEAGSGAPPMLLVHGFCGNHMHLAPQFEHFRRSRRVVAVDRRGHGASDQPDQAYSIAEFADDLAWLCHQLGLYKPTLVVHSMGAIGLELAAQRPDLLGALVLLDAPFDPPAEVQAGFQQLLAGLRSPHYQAALRGVADALIFLPTDDPRRKEWLLDGMCAVPQHVIVATWEQLLLHDTPAAARACRVPLLHIRSVFPANLAGLHELCPQLVTAQVADVGHFLQLEAPAQVNAIIERFLTEQAVSHAKFG